MCMLALKCLSSPCVVAVVAVSCGAWWALEGYGMHSHEGMARVAMKGMAHAAAKGMVRTAVKGMARTATRGMVHTAARGTMRHVHVASTCLSSPHTVAIVAVGCGRS
jgi:hypothetical protein